MLSLTVEYALRAMTNLASLPPGEAANSESIAAQTKVPHGYLSKVLRSLTVAELIVSRRGPNGGFTLALAPSRISMLDVVNAVEPLKRITKCPLGNPGHLALCPLHSRLDNAIALIEREFAETSLAEVIATAGKASAQCRTLVALKVKKERR